MEQGSTGFSADVAWYRSFHDVPRLFCVRVPRGYVLFDSKFDDAIDDYEPQYTVRFVFTVEALEPERVLDLATTLEPIGTLDVKRELWDESRRKRVTLPRRIGVTDLL